MRARWRTYACEHVAFDGTQACSVDFDEAGDLVAFCERCLHDPSTEAPDVHVVAWGCLVDRDPSLLMVDDALEPGRWHWRSAPGQPWVVETTTRGGLDQHRM